MKIEIVLQIIAVILAGFAAYFLWIGYTDVAFITIVLGCVAFFLIVRFQAKVRNTARENERLDVEKNNENAS